MFECTLVILTELRTGGGAFLVIQCFCKTKDNNHTMNSAKNNIKRTKD